MEAGYTVLQYDLKHGDDVRWASAWSVRFDIWNVLRIRGAGDYQIVMVLCAPPCTDFSISGAQYWPKKDADGRTAQSLAILDACVRLAAALSPSAWVMENPVGRLGTLRPSLGSPKYFHPWEYAYWGIDHEERTANRYTKKTGLWGHFRMPAIDPLPPIRVCKQGSWLQKLGGKSERTKELRSMTPMAFSRAFFAANSR